MILLISLLPQVFLSFVGGVIADSRSKKNILVLGNVGRAVVVFLLFFFNGSVMWVYALALLVSVVTQFYIPAETPIIPKLVPERLLIAANSLFGLALFGSILIGYVLAGPILTMLGNSNVFLVLAALFALAGIFANLIPKHALLAEATVKRKVKAQVEESLKSYFIDTYKLLLGTVGVASSFILLIVSQVVIMVIAIIVPGYAKDILHIGVENVSLLLFAPAAIGMIVAALTVGTLLKKANRDKLMDTGVILSGVVLLLLPLVSSSGFQNILKVVNVILPILYINDLAVVFVLAFFAGVGNALIFIPAQTTIQEKIPENFRSKIYGLLFALIGLFSLLPIVLVGGLADSLGVNFVLVVIGVLITVGGSLRIISLNIIKKVA